MYTTQGTCTNLLLQLDTFLQSKPTEVTMSQTPQPAQYYATTATTLTFTNIAIKPNHAA